MIVSTNLMVATTLASASLNSHPHHQTSNHSSRVNALLGTISPFGLIAMEQHPSCGLPLYELIAFLTIIGHRTWQNREIYKTVVHDGGSTKADEACHQWIFEAKRTAYRSQNRCAKMAASRCERQTDMALPGVGRGSEIMANDRCRQVLSRPGHGECLFLSCRGH